MIDTSALSTVGSYIKETATSLAKPCLEADVGKFLMQTF